MANFTTCSFSVPIKLTTATTIKLTLSASGIGAQTPTATATAGTFYNNMDTTISGTTDNLMGRLLHLLNTAEAGLGTDGVWSLVEVTTSDYRGRFNLSRAKGDAADVVTQLELLGGEVTLAMIGSAADPATPTSGSADPAVFPIVNRGQGHWVLDDVSLLAGSEERQQSIQTSTTSPDGTTVRDVYGSTTRKRIDLLTIPGASVFVDYVNDADYAAVIGCNTGDPNATLDELRRHWCLADDDVYTRFTPDVGTPATYVSLQPGNGDEWLTSLDTALEMVSDGPLYFDATLSAFKV